VLVQAAHEANLAIHVWTVDDETDMHRLVELGVDGIMTDVPTALVAVLRRDQAQFKQV
jgi:glycerophosphoryl diester phosphodiesterase